MEDFASERYAVCNCVCLAHIPFTPNTPAHISVGKCWIFWYESIAGSSLWERTAPKGADFLTLLTGSEHELSTFQSHRLTGKETQKLTVKSRWHEGETFSKLQVITVHIGRKLTAHSPERVWYLYPSSKRILSGI